MHFHVTVSVSPGYVLVYAAFIFMWILLCDFYFRIDLFMWNYRSYKYHFSYAHIGTFSLIPIISSKNTYKTSPMNCLIGVYRIIIKIIHDFSLFLPINPPIIRLQIGITSKMRCSPKGNEPTRLLGNNEAMFPKGEQAHPTTKPSGQQRSDVPRRGTSPHSGRLVLWCVAASDRWKCAGT